MSKVRIRTFKIPYTIKGEGKEASLSLNEAEQIEGESIEVDITNKPILTLATEIGNENQKEKQLALAVGELEGFITIKKIAE